MDYKKIIRSQSTRSKILRLFSFVPDKTMVQIQYFIKMGRFLNLKNPKRFTEKMQWYKLNYKDSLMIQCVDKFDVREYVKSKGLEEILIPCYGVYDKVEDINWGELPKSFVIKDTLGGGGNSLALVKDKETIDIEKLKARAKTWTQRDYRRRIGGREWPYYSGKKHRLIIEKLIESENKLLDYKFFCFNGRVVFLYVMGERELGKSVKVSIFDRNFNKMPVKRVGDEECNNVSKPEGFKKMIYIAEKLASPFPHVRVDLYNLNGFILFGELTFYNASGYMLYDPDSFDIEIGKEFILPSKVEKRSK